MKILELLKALLDTLRPECRVVTAMARVFWAWAVFPAVQSVFEAGRDRLRLIVRLFRGARTDYAWQG